VALFRDRIDFHETIDHAEPMIRWSSLMTDYGVGRIPSFKGILLDARELLLGQIG